MASSLFLKRLKSLYPVRAATNGTIHVPVSSHNGSSSGGRIFPRRNPWYLVAAVAFTIPDIFQYEVRNIEGETAHGVDVKQQTRLVARKMREALFKSGLTSGYPRVINSLIALHDVMPVEFRETACTRDTSVSINEYEKRGAVCFQSIYGQTAEETQNLLDRIYPDMGWFSKTIGYGLTYGHTDILSPLETSYSLVAALIAGGTPRQITWHLDGAQRSGATQDEIRAVRQIAMEVTGLSRIEWTPESVPEVRNLE
ncbi:AhpD-like protein [Infundibulicybe gibba]|nr:AhpD-like protein [Infundibulicybe gibba]